MVSGEKYHKYSIKWNIVQYYITLHKIYVQLVLLDLNLSLKELITLMSRSTFSNLGVPVINMYRDNTAMLIKYSDACRLRCASTFIFEAIQLINCYNNQFADILLEALKCSWTSKLKRWHHSILTRSFLSSQKAVLQILSVKNFFWQGATSFKLSSLAGFQDISLLIFVEDLFHIADLLLQWIISRVD